MDIFISLIIPAYNAEKYIASCLDSAINQTYANYEIIVVNDGSTDRTLEICREYESRCSFLRVLHREENRGLVYSWQEGVDAASGDYIAFLDSDDWLDCRYLEALAAGIDGDCDLVCCNFKRVFRNHSILYTEKIRSGSYDKKQIIRDIYPVLLNDGTYLGRGLSPHRWGKLFRASLLRDNLIYSDGQIIFGEDLNIFFAVIMDCSKLVVLDDRQGLYCYRQNEASIIHTYKPNMFAQIDLLRIRLLKIMRTKKVYDFEDQINRDFWSLFVDYVKNATRAPDLATAFEDVCLNFEVSQKEVPWLELKLKPADKILIFCLQRKLFGVVSLWMRLYSFLKKG